ncbi:MAG: Xaa-Pro peptidase family protein [Armatimonadota bacterium]|nr:Xaa-Pro peptidase family protein [Armatimonadota bacterium]
MILFNADRAEALVAEAHLDGLVAATQENFLYTTGILNVNAFVLPRIVQAYAVLCRDGLTTPAVVMGAGDADQYLTAFPGVGPLYLFGTFYREAPHPEVLDDREQRLQILTADGQRHQGPGDALVAALRGTGLTAGTIGLDEEGVHPSVIEHVAGHLPGIRLVNASALFRTIRMVKTAAEIARLQRAQAACEAGIQAVATMARAGVTERAMAAAYAAGVGGAGGRVTFALIRIGRNAALGQLPPDDTPLRYGDHVWLDVGAQVEGYHADLARILALGEPNTKLRRYYAAALRGEEHAFAVTRPGMTADRVFQETVDVVRRSGIPHYRRHHVGHGIGAEVYDPPVLNLATSTPIEAGMVINVETPYYELGWGAIHVEDPYVVAAHGHNRWLTTMSRDLLIVE